MRKTNFILTLIFTVICGFNIANAREVYVDNKVLCERTKGIWRLFTNSCADNCKDKFANPICTSYNFFACDCGENKCWDGGKCISDKIAKIAYDELVKQQEEARIKELKDAGIDPDSPEQMAAAQISQPQTIQNPTTPAAQTPQKEQTKQPTPEPELKLPPVVAAPTPAKPELSEQVKLAMENPDVAKKMQEKKQICEKQGGEWIEFPNGCADNCASKVASVNMCTQSLTYSCKCGGTKCWDGLSNVCVELEEYKKGLTIF